MYQPLSGAQAFELRGRSAGQTPVPPLPPLREAARWNSASPAASSLVTRNYLLHREEGKRPQRGRLLTEAILRCHGLAVKERRRGCAAVPRGRRSMAEPVGRRDLSRARDELIADLERPAAQGAGVRGPVGARNSAP